MREATDFCRRVVPNGPRAAGRPGVDGFLAGKEGSHIVPRSAGGPDTPSNIVAEDAGTNRARGAKTMTALDRQRARWAKFTGNLKGALRAAPRSLPKVGGAFGLLYAAPEAVCQWQAVQAGEATAAEAGAEVGKDALIGAAVGAGAAAAVGAGMALAAPVATVVGGAVIVVGAVGGGVLVYDTVQAATDPEWCAGRGPGTGPVQP